MTFCSKCGAQLLEEAFFCSKCGVRTIKGKESNVPIPWEDVFHDVGEEIQSALSTAGKELEKVFKTASAEIGKENLKKSIVCPTCSWKNYSDSRFCNKCGGKIQKGN